MRNVSHRRGAVRQGDSSGVMAAYRKNDGPAGGVVMNHQATMRGERGALPWQTPFDSFARPALHADGLRGQLATPRKTASVEEAVATRGQMEWFTPLDAAHGV